MVVEERENIAPGFHSLLTAKLKPGEYEITCGLLSNPRGRLVVTPSETSEAERAAPPITAFIGPLSEHKVWLTGQSGQLIEAVTALDAAIQAGDLDGARAAWLSARLPYKRMEAVTGRIADLENSIDPLPDYLEKREDDPAFTGFHRIEYGLWGQNGLEGLAPVSARLLADVTALKDRLREMRLAPEELAGTAARLADRLANGQIAAGEDHWAGADLAGFEANLDGIAKGAELVLPLAKEADPATGAAFGKAMGAVREALGRLHRDGQFPAYDQIDKGTREDLAGTFAALAQAIGAINPAIGLE